MSNTYVAEDGTTTITLDAGSTAVEIVTHPWSAAVSLVTHGGYQSAMARLTPDQCDELAGLLARAASDLRVAGGLL